ncbi:hypothetical protein M427DRAFT_57256 [Gonapodya prolifera JEL478]|uniref:Uncharacterized protein n=1 Tax=Gonapodya prolifera (strain JEL478) TaxID=1344416 RepID=A0A139ADG2_GONPJ|nr:hypothetical protein M427DRAFT_57256 [Gonapodya prolifera JEL478]|eukprot:KXS14852.1 hypothetical protein M427DRAFT_57256 [Gonapodya prolifera JEL478]
MTTHILTDVDPRRLVHYMKGGERQAWPKVHMIANRMAIEVAIAEGHRKREEQMQWERSREGRMQTNLSLGGVGMPDDEDDDHLLEDASDPDADLRS